MDTRRAGSLCAPSWTLVSPAEGRRRNTSDRFPHEALVRIESPDGEVREHYDAALEPHRTLSVDRLKLVGWPIPDGSRVSVCCKRYLLHAGPVVAADDMSASRHFYRQDKDG